jgi:uncharacterized protein (DUF2236 family)
VPRSCSQIEDYLQRMRPQLLCDARSLEVMDILLKAPAPSRLAEPVGKLMLQAVSTCCPAGPSRCSACSRACWPGA